MKVSRKKENEVDTKEQELEKDRSCSLCLSKELLMLTSHLVTIKDIKITIQQLIEDLQMDETSRDPLALAAKQNQICRPCVKKIYDFYVFKKNCTKITEYSIKRVNVSQANTPVDSNKTKTLIDINMPNDDSTDFKNCPKCAQFVTENNDYKVTQVNAITSHRCNICNEDFENHPLTISHLEEHEYADLNMDGIKQRGIDLFGCNVCNLKDVPWETYIEHLEIHEHERVTKMILKMKLFCCYCLKEDENVVDISKEISLNGVSDKKINIEDLLLKVFKIKNLKRKSGTLICEECIERAIAVFSFHEMYKKSTKTLKNCVKQLQYCLRATDKIDYSRGQAIKMRIHFDFHKNKPVETIDLDKLDTMSTTSSNDAQAEESILSSCTDPTEHPVKIKQENKEGVLTSSLENGEKNEDSAQAKPKTPNSDKKKFKYLYCKTCREFMKCEDFVVHMKETKYKCPACDRSHCTRIANNKHMSRAHASERTHKCALCVEILQNSEVDAHMERKHSIVKYICDECNKYFYDKNKLCKHILKDHNNMQSGPAKCKNCIENFVTRCDALKHKCKKIKCTKMYKCSECFHYPCIHDKYLKKFTEEEHTKLEHACLDCDFVYSKKSVLIEHVNMSHLAYYNHLFFPLAEKHSHRTRP